MAEEDWRLRNQEKYLLGKTLTWKRYTTRSEEWDHDHCAFCWQKFMDQDLPDVHREGYATEDDYYWICKICYEDFKDRFQWKLVRT